jgi:hypothetical protein
MFAFRNDNGNGGGAEVTWNGNGQQGGRDGGRSLGSVDIRVTAPGAVYGNLPT